MDHQAVSELGFGLVLKAKEAGDDISGIFSPDSFVEPYNFALKEVPNMDMAELKATFGFDAMRAAEYAAEEESIDSAVEWAKALEKVASYTDIGHKVIRIGKKLVEGRNGDGDALLSLAAKLDKGQSGFVSMADVDDLDPSEIYRPSFFGPIDENSGGWPNSGLTIVAGPPKMGKSTLLIQALAATARQEKYTALFALEMSKELVKYRLLQIKGMYKKHLKYILIDDEKRNASQVYAQASRLCAEYDLYLIAIDYASKMAIGRPIGPDVMGEIYSTIGSLPGVTGVPVTLLAGVSRGYVGGEPAVNHIYYSSLAEHEASLIMLAYNPGLLDVDTSSNKQSLPYVPDCGWLKFGAARMGLKRGSLGAALVAWDDKKGAWGNTTKEWWPKLTG